MEIRLGKVKIGPGNPPILFPDIDIYFKRDENLAFRLISSIREAGLPILKGALIVNEDLALDLDTQYWSSQGKFVKESYRKILQRHIATADTDRRIYARARDQGLDLVLSVYDEETIDLALELGAIALKIPSSNIVHAPLIRSVAKTGLPIIVDTGRSSIEEIDRAIGWVREGGNVELIIQHSPPGPPAPVTDFNMRMMPFLGKRYNCPIGLSDHWSGVEMIMMSVGMGAHIIEKGICDDEASDDIDIVHALRISDLAATVERIDWHWKALGSEMRTLPEDYQRPTDRMGLTAQRDLQPGETMNEETISFTFPTIGIPIEDWDKVNGRTLQRALKSKKALKWSDLNDE